MRPFIGALIALSGMAIFGTLSALSAVLLTVTIDFAKWVAGNE